MFWLALTTVFALLGGRPLQVEIVETPQEATWGMMGRSKMPQDTGMLFPFAHHRFPPRLWNFNCLMDLDVAFLDEEGMIREIRLLKAHPDWMDPKRPVKSLADLEAYPPDDPIRQRFSQESIEAHFPASAALELPAGWLKAHQVTVGDRLQLSR